MVQDQRNKVSTCRTVEIKAALIISSAAGPVFAGIVSQLNSLRLAQGKPRMGSLNPWLYTVGKTGLTDITLGGSRGCYGSSQTGISTPHVPYASWNATEGLLPDIGRVGTLSRRTLMRGLS
jgi:tripeptidyl-peptidase-1